MSSSKLMLEARREKRTLKREGRELPGLAAFVFGFSAPRLIDAQALKDAFIDTGFCTVRSFEAGVEDWAVACKSIGKRCKGIETFPYGVTVIASIDLCPNRPGARTRWRFGTLDNDRLIRAVRRLRNATGSGRKGGAGPAVFATATASFAIEVLESIQGDIEEVIKAGKEMRERFETDVPVIGSISSSCLRAKLEIIPFGTGKAVRKTFMPGYEGYLRAEVTARRLLSETITEVDASLDVGPNYLTMPLYNALRLAGDNTVILHPIGHARNTVRYLKRLYDAGYAMIDGNTHSILYDDQGNPKVVDFEYLYKYPVQPSSFEACYDIAGVPQGLDIPGAHIAGSFSDRWKPWIGLTYEELTRTYDLYCHTVRFFYVLRKRVPRVLNITLQRSGRLIRDCAQGTWRFLTKNDAAWVFPR